MSAEQMIPEKDFLLLKEQSELKEQSKQPISIVRPFFSILIAAKSKKRVYSESNIVSPKRSKLLRRISPLALPSSSSSKQISDECHENLLQPGMKLI